MINTKMEAYYSQNDEQKILLRHVGKIEHGVVIDIGAGDGRTFSNSLALIERGWRALCIEPSPVAFKKLLDLHGGNPNVTLLNAAIGVDTRIVKFYESDDSLYSTTHESHAKLWTERGMKYRTYHVAQLTVKDVVSQLGASANVLSIDCEGASFDILGSCPSAWDVKLIIIEHDNRAVEISGWARERGYDVVSLNAENVILMRPE